MTFLMRQIEAYRTSSSLRTVDTDPYPVEVVNLHTLGVRLPVEAVGPYRREVDARFLGARSQSHVHLMRNLSRQFVERERCSAGRSQWPYRISSPASVVLIFTLIEMPMVIDMHR